MELILSTKPRKPRASAAKPGTSAGEPNLESTSANNIWFAGLGALAKAQAEGSKAFEALVQEGIDAQRATQVAAQQRMEAFTQRVEAINQNVAASAGRWSGLESIFEIRVSRALTALGLPSQAAWQELLKRVERLEHIAAQSATTDSQPGSRVTAAAKKTRKTPNPSP